MPTKLALIAKHKKQWSKCTLCPLGKDAYRHVLYDGSLPAKYLFIGEAPGECEDATGTPFIGPAGKILREMLRDCKLDKSQYCITNVLACFPRKEDDPTSFRKPKNEEAKACSPRVRDIFELCEPNLVILLGVEARKYYNKYILQPSDAFLKFNTLDLKHPSYILRNGGIGSVEYLRNMIKLKDAIDEQFKKEKTNKKRSKKNAQE